MESRLHDFYAVDKPEWLDYHAQRDARVIFAQEQARELIGLPTSSRLSYHWLPNLSPDAGCYGNKLVFLE